MRQWFGVLSEGNTSKSTLHFPSQTNDVSPLNYSLAAGRWNVLALDQRGHGESPLGAEEDYCIDNVRAALHQSTNPPIHQSIRSSTWGTSVWWWWCCCCALSACARPCGGVLLRSVCMCNAGRGMIIVQHEGA